MDIIQTVRFTFICNIIIHYLISLIYTIGLAVALYIVRPSATEFLLYYANTMESGVDLIYLEYPVDVFNRDSVEKESLFFTPRFGPLWLAITIAMLFTKPKISKYINSLKEDYIVSKVGFCFNGRKYIIHDANNIANISYKHVTEKQTSCQPYATNLANATEHYISTNNIDYESPRHLFANNCTFSSDLFCHAKKNNTVVNYKEIMQHLRNLP